MEGIKARNEERRKRKEAKLKRGTDEVRQKTMSKNLGYSTLGTPKEIGLSSNPYMAKTRIEPPLPRNPAPNYYTSYLSFSPSSQTKTIVAAKKEAAPALTEVKSFMEDEEEEVSVAFEELMSEIAKYEGSEKQQSKPESQTSQP